MEFIPVKTSILTPPQDDLFAALDQSLFGVQAGDVLVVSSKVVAIHEGRCLSEEEYDQAAHIESEAEMVIPRPHYPSPLTAVNHVFVGGMGVDRSNSDGYVTLLPADPFHSAQTLYAYVTERFSTKELGVIITDSVSVPCRYGAIGTAIGFWGLHPIVSHIGKTDLFGLTIKYAHSNVIDGIAAGATVVMGEVAERTPLVIARGVPNVQFTDSDQRAKLFCPPDDDILGVLYERFRS